MLQRLWIWYGSRFILFFIQYLFNRVYQQFNITGSDHQDDFELTGFGSHHVPTVLPWGHPFAGDSHGIEDDLRGDARYRFFTCRVDVQQYQFIQKRKTGGKVSGKITRTV